MSQSDIATLAQTTIERLVASGRPAIAFTGRARVEDGAPLQRYIDHTLLKQEATADQYRNLCGEARSAGTRSVCVPPDRVALCVAELEGSAVEVCTVVGFPFGYQSTAAKAADVTVTRELGATEFDMVIPVGRVRDGLIEELYDDVRAVVAAADGLLVKVILETSALTDEQKVAAAATALHAGAAIIKTSTGFASGGATLEDLALMRAVAGDDRGVKASGGIRDRAFAEACIAAGADRIGASATVAILAGTTGGSDY